MGGRARAGGAARLDPDSMLISLFMSSHQQATQHSAVEGREARRPQPSALSWWCPLRSETLHKAMSVFDLTLLCESQDPAPLQTSMCY